MNEKLNVGDLAPDFNLPGSDKKNHKLSDYKGKTVVLYFYPKDQTPGCTTEAKGFTENFDQYQNQNVIILGVSKDSLKSHDKFIEKLGIPFVLLTDEDTQMMQDYGVYREKTVFGKVGLGIVRTTFLIDENGMIQKIYEKPKTANHAEEILKDLAEIKKA